MIQVRQKSVEELIDKELYEGRGADEILDRFRNCVVVRALNIKEGNITKTAEMLKCHRNTLTHWMDEGKISLHYLDNELGQ
jgi:DNA-binding NtrC family response regulator